MSGRCGPKTTLGPASEASQSPTVPPRGDKVQGGWKGLQPPLLGAGGVRAARFLPRESLRGHLAHGPGCSLG